MEKVIDTPKTGYFIHLIVGDHPRPFDINHYYAILSNIVVNKLDKVILLVNDFNKLKDNSYVRLLKQHYPEVFNLKSLTEEDLMDLNFMGCIYPAHMADYLRLKYLRTFGGVYFDTDCIAIRPLPSEWFTSGKAYWGYENDGSNTSICNNVIISPEFNPFITKVYLEYYRRFNPELAVPGPNWAYYGVTMPLDIYKECIDIQDDVHICEGNNFQYYWMKYHEIEKLFFLDDFSNLINCETAYELHLWENRTRDIIKNFSPKYFIDNHSTYARLINHLAVKYDKGKEFLLVE